MKIIYRVLEEYRDAWSNDVWDGYVTMDEIKRLALEWDKEIDELMGQVETINN